MHTVKKAIIMAAGIGQRMQPLTLKTPKPLIKVNGIRMIDSVIEGLHKNGIYEIYVVIGHLKEKFYDLIEKYPDIKLIENPFYKTCNNISSLYMAREHLEDSIILDGDQVIYNCEVLRPDFEHSGYNCIQLDRSTNEWVLRVENGIVRSCSRNGGNSGWQLYSISRWTSEDGQKLKSHLELEFEIKKNRQIYWDDIPLFYHPEDYMLSIQKMQRGDVIEIDSLHELAAIDTLYEKYI